MDELLHKTLKRSDTGFPGKTSRGGGIERWLEGRQRGEGVSAVEGEMGVVVHNTAL